MRAAAAIVAVLAGASTLAAQPVLTLQETLLRAKPAVAMIVSEVRGRVTVRCDAGAPSTTVTLPPSRETGTGWFVSPAGWLITNAHVVATAHRPPRWLVRERTAWAVREACPPAAVGATATSALETAISVLLPNGLKLPAMVVKYSPPVADEEMSGQDLALLRVEAADMPTLRLGDSAPLKIGDRIHIVGFPSVVLDHELLSATARMEASITSGAVSGFRVDRANQPVIQTDAPAAWGNSGGPAMNHAGDVVGVLTFVAMRSAPADAAVQGFNFVIPSGAVAKFLEGTPVPLDEASRFNAAWHTGLHQHFLADYRRARGFLAEADRLVPDLPDVRRVVAENESRLAREPWLPWRPIAVALLVASGVGYAALGFRSWRRNRFRIPPSEVARLIESPEPPVILDVRDTATYAKSPAKIPRSLHAPLEALQRDRLPADPDRTVIAYCT
jgi:S1-C subfamily serine protease